MQNRFLTETLMRNFETASGASPHTIKRNSWVENTGAYVNELFITSELDRITNQLDSKKINDQAFIEPLKSDEKYGDQSFMQNSSVSGVFMPEYFTQMSERSLKFYKEIELLSYRV